MVKDRISKALELAKNGQQPVLQRVKRAKNDENVEKINYTQTQVFSVSLDTLKKHRIIAGFPDEPLADNYRILRTKVMHRMRQNNWKTVGITSADPGVGKTLTSINLGISISMDTKYTVLLVDADLRRPSIHKFFEINPKFGLSDYLSSDMSVDELLINPGIDRFVILPCVNAAKGSSELLAHPKMIHLVEEIKKRYPSRYVIFDLPPALVGDDVVAFSALLDTAILVIEEGKTQSDELIRTVELLKNLDLLGTVLNKTSEAAHGYQYQY